MSHLPCWEWKAGEVRDGRSYVDRYDRNDGRDWTYGNSILCQSRRQAQEIANALNFAFNEGVKYGKDSVLSEMVKETRELDS
jgi:hypothetical protein